jgi:biotin carboxylase
MGDFIEVLGRSEKSKCAPPYSFDMRLIFPGAHRPEIVAALRQVNTDVIRAIGIRIGFAHVEMMITPQGVRMIEIAARGSGGRVATDLLPALTGIDLLAARLRQALGEDVSLPPAQRDRFGILRFFELPPGTIRSVSGLAQAAAQAGVIHFEFMPKPGDTIRRAVSADQRPGFMLAVGNSREEIIDIADRVTSIIKVEMQ